jgi:nucleoside-diphosphate-sugar epimerase
MSKKILITGGAGYVGGYLTDELIRRGYDVTVYDNLVYEERFLKKVPFIFGDIRDYQKLQTLLPDYDTVIHLAAVVGDGACAVDQQLTTAINEEATKWLTDHFKGKIVYTSTCSVYGINHDLINEEATPNPLSAYAATKLAGEQYIAQNHDNHLIFRLGTLYGMGDEHSRIRLDLVANVLAKRAVLGEELRVFGGEQWRPLLHVKDVTTAIIYGLENNITGLFNLGSGNWRIRDMAEEIAHTVPNTRIVYQDIKFEDLRNYKVDTGKVLKTGWMPQFTLSDGIREMSQVISEGRIKDINDSVYSNVDYLSKIWKTK